MTQTKDIAKTPAASKVSERLEWLVGKRVFVRVGHSDSGQPGGETFHATYIDVVPLGREYFFVLQQSSVTRMIRTSSVIELSEAV